MTAAISLAWRLAIQAYRDAATATDPALVAYHMAHGDRCIAILRDLLSNGDGS